LQPSPMDPGHGQYYGQQPPPLMPSGETPPSRHRSSLSGASSSQQANAAKYRKLEPAPTPPHRIGWTDNGSELRTVHYDYKEGIKDYKPVEAPPQHGPRKIRGWTYNALKKPRGPKPGPSSDHQGNDKDDAN
jgi:hypothetical protein